MLGVIVFVAMCSVASAQPFDSTQDKQPVLAIMVPLSGDLAGLGEQLLESAKLAGSRQGLRIEAIDEGESIEESLQAIEGLADRDEVAAVIGPLRRKHGPAVARRAQRAKLPILVYSSHDGVERTGDMVFRARPSLREQSRRLASYLVEEREKKEIALMAPRSEYGDDMTLALIEAINDGEGQVRAMARYADETTDFRAPLEVLTGQRAYVGTGRVLAGRSADRWGTVRLQRPASIEFEALVIADFHDRVARILPFLPGAGIATGASHEGTAIQLMGLSSWRGDGLARAGVHGRGALFFDTFGGETDGGMARQFVISFQQATGRNATTPEAEVYDLVTLISDSIDAGSTDRTFRQTVVDRLRKPQAFEGVSGTWQFDERGAPLRQLNLYQVIAGGRWVRTSGEHR